MKKKNVPVAFLDASVLYPALLRDILMRLALKDLYQPHWSAKVQEEWITAVLRNRRDIERTQLERVCCLMETHAEDALVEGYEYLIPTLNLPDENDRHVLAAAIHCQASTIVTANLRDFPRDILASHQIIAWHPDVFLMDLIDQNKARAGDAFNELCKNRKNPTQTPDEVIEILKQQGLVKIAMALSVLQEGGRTP